MLCLTFNCSNIHVPQAQKITPFIKYVSYIFLLFKT